MRQAIVFSTASPTGWRQVGQSAFRPFLPERAEPFALAPGDAVRFAAVGDGEYDALAADNADGMGGARREL